MVVQQQRCFAGRWRTFELRACYTDTGMARRESRQNFAQLLGTGKGV
jgi:hypothetical protein